MGRIPTPDPRRGRGEVRGCSRHGTDLTARLGSLLAPFTDVARGTTFDGELVAVSERDGRSPQDFAAVTRGGVYRQARRDGPAAVHGL